MSTLNVSLPDTLKTFVDEQVGRYGYDAGDEFVRELIRKEKDRQQLRDLLLAGAESAPTEAVDAQYFDTLRTQVRRSVA
jgi:antitoxin ParD1/3/4